MIKRKALESLKPDVIIEVNGKKVKISNVTSVKTAVQEWTLDEPSKYDPGSGTEETFINSVEVNNKTLFINKRFALNKMFHQNASKFAIFYV